MFWRMMRRVSAVRYASGIVMRRLALCGRDRQDALSPGTAPAHLSSSVRSSHCTDPVIRAFCWRTMRWRAREQARSHRMGLRCRINVSPTLSSRARACSPCTPSPSYQSGPSRMALQAPSGWPASGLRPRSDQSHPPGHRSDTHCPCRSCALSSQTMRAARAHRRRSCASRSDP